MTAPLSPAYTITPAQHETVEFYEGNGGWASGALGQAGDLVRSAQLDPDGHQFDAMPINALLREAERLILLVDEELAKARGAA